MTMKPKAKKFRISNDDDQKTAADTEGLIPTETDDGFGSETFPPLDDASPNPEDAIDAIRQEGLTGRQLRMARRVARKQGLSPVSDYDAVRLLREMGVDPFNRTSILELVISGSETESPQNIALPATTTAQAGLPAIEAFSEAARARNIIDIQRDIIRRRRRRSAMLAIRLLFFVVLPTVVAGYYYGNIATPMYATKSEFVIQKAESSLGGGSSLFSGTSFATAQDSITVQGYLQSRDAMLRLDQDENFKSHYSQPHIDVLQRLAPDASNEAAYKVFKKRVRIGFDPTEGVIKMEVIAANPQISADFSKKLISYAEQQVDQLTARLRSDQMEGAEASRREANDKMILSQQRIVDIQEKLGVLSPESEVNAVMGQIASLETELLSERLSLQSFLSNPRPNQPKVNAATNKIAELEKLINEKRAQLTNSNSSSGSLARITGELMVAQADLETRQELLAQAMAQFEAARLEANRQVRYLSVGVNPIAPDEPTYPRAFENTVLAFLIFSAIYLMISLTASILREQV